MGYFKDKTIKLEEDMTRYIENCTKEIMTELKLNDSAKEVITMVLQRNLDTLFKLLLEEQEDDNNHIHTEKKET